MDKYRIVRCPDTGLYQVEADQEGRVVVEFRTSDPFEAADWMTLTRMEDDQAIYCRFG